MQRLKQVQKNIKSQNCNTASSNSKPQHFRYVIVGGGISALQTALILAEYDQDFIILEASDHVGGRICTLTLGAALDEDCFDCDFAWLQTQKMRKLPIECGATWIAEDQSFMKYFTKKYGLTLFPQYEEGKFVLALDQNKILFLDNLGDYYNQYRINIQKLFSTIKTYTKRMQELGALKKQNSLTASLQDQLSSIMNKYDTMTAYQFILNQVEDKELANLLGKEIQTLECVSIHKFTALQLFTDDKGSSLANIRFYIGDRNANIDGFKVKEGMYQTIINMKAEVQSIFNLKKNGKKIDDLIILNQPVKNIWNDKNPVKVVTCKGRTFTCEKAITCLPIATMDRIQFSSLSPGKRLIIQNQLTCNMTRMSLVFRQPWWRPHNSGYASFSHHFPMNEFVDLTPSDQSCGILAFVFTADGFDKWHNEIMSECQGLKGEQLQRKWYAVNKRKSIQIVADIYLDGNINHDNLKEVALFARSLSRSSYIKSTYEATTGPGVYKAMVQKKLDLVQSKQGDELNLIVLGSDFSDEHSGYMEGAIRFARKKIYSLCGQKDPLGYLASQA